MKVEIHFLIPYTLYTQLQYTTYTFSWYHEGCGHGFAISHHKYQYSGKDQGKVGNGIKMGFWGGNVYLRTQLGMSTGLNTLLVIQRTVLSYPKL